MATAGPHKQKAEVSRHAEEVIGLLMAIDVVSWEIPWLDPLCCADGQPVWECHLYSDDSSDTCDRHLLVQRPLTCELGHESASQVSIRWRNGFRLSKYVHLDRARLCLRPISFHSYRHVNNSQKHIPALQGSPALSVVSTEICIQQSRSLTRKGPPALLPRCLAVNSEVGFIWSHKTKASSPSSTLKLPHCGFFVPSLEVSMFL